MIQYRLFIALLLLANHLSAQEGNIPFVRFPALSPDGKQIAFSYEGDIWTMPAEGGLARRLTVHEAYEEQPQWSPDGKSIVFQGNRFGNNDLFLIDAQGGNPVRLTYHSAGDGNPKWGPDGTILFSTARYFRELERVPEVYQIDASGGTPYRVMDALGHYPAPSPDGRFIAYMDGSSPIDREPYMGPASHDIWIFDKKNNTYTQITTFKGMDILPDWGGANQLYYLSAEKGRYNLYTQFLNAAGKPEGKPLQLTSYTDEGIRNFDVSADGKTIVFEKGNRIYLMPADGKPKVVDVQVSTDSHFDAVETTTQSGSATEFALSPNGKLIAFSVRGEIFVTLNDKESKRTAAITNHPYRDQTIQWLDDSTMLFRSDRTGNFEIYLARSADPEQSSLYRTLKLETVQLTNTPEDESLLVIAPNRKKIAVLRGRGELTVWDIDSSGAMTNAVKLLDGWATPSGIAWSPDSRWLAYALDDLNFNEEIYIHAADNSIGPVNVSMHPRSDVSPVWSPDGSKLGFLSLRNNGDYDVWFAWLKKSDWEKTKPDWDEEKEDKPEKKNGKDEKNGDGEDTPLVEIDLKDIYERLEQVTHLAGNEDNLVISKDGQTFYFTTNGFGRTGSTGDPDLMSAQWDGSELKRLSEKFRGRGLELDKSGKNIYFLQNGGQLSKLIVDGNKQETIPFQAKMKIDHPEELKQMFAEGWRSLRDGFYDPKFHGRDWESLRKRYEVYALSASTTQDFQDMFNEMLGQLDASHMGFRGPTPESTQRDQTGDLGIEVKPVKDGVEILRIIPESPAGKSDSKLETGMIIRAVNGEPVSGDVNFFSLLNNTANQRILLEVRSADDSIREIPMRPISSINNLLYENWVERCKQLTEKYSNGRLGYIHIQGMDWPSFERFERELMAAGDGKEGIVIDVRYNGGGWTTDMLMAVLSVRQHSYTIPRGAADNLNKEHDRFKDYYPYGERLPLSAWTKPSVALCNESSYSNAEIFSHAFKTLGIGKLVGTPTFGAVISTGAQGLIDGSYVRMPFRGWYVKATGENMENGPAVPDYVLKNSPDSKARGEDEQLRKAVEVLLDQIK
ncbi:MAG: PD40 domain-containing protein [Lewinellaceae bacterium]|nr:PD40 domain-containing protein [Lewinellaceae bacterium]